MTISRMRGVSTLAAMAVVLWTGVARADIKSAYVDYAHGATALRGYLVYEENSSGKRPGVLVIHNRRGMSDKALKDAEMIAKLGYVVFAIDMFGKGILPQSPAEMTALTSIYDRDRPLMRARALAGLDVLRANALVDASHIALIGYCFGGTVAIELAEMGVPIVGTVAVHGSFRNFTPEAAKNIKGRVLILHGAEDETAPLEEVNRLIADLRAAHVEWELNLYSGAAHGFTEPENPSEQRADSAYKGAVERFFRSVFGR